MAAGSLTEEILVSKMRILPKKFREAVSCFKKNYMHWPMTIKYINKHMGNGVFATKNLPKHYIVGLYAG